MSLISGIFCGGGACRMERTLPSGVKSHAPAEILSTQGVTSRAGSLPQPFPVAQEWRPRTGRGSSIGSGSFICASPDFLSRTSIGSSPARSGVGSSFALNGFNEVHGGHLACTAAAVSSQDPAGYGRGLFVSLQRGMSFDSPGSPSKSRSFEISHGSGSDSFRDLIARHPAKIRSESPGRMIPASEYVAAPEDQIDAIVAQQCRFLPSHRAKALLIRRIACGEYEVDGAPVRFFWARGDCNSNEVMVCTPGQERQGSEPLQRYLSMAAERAVARAPLELELPTFPWPLPDLLSKTASSIDVAPSTPSRTSRTSCSPLMGTPVGTPCLSGRPPARSLPTPIPAGRPRCLPTGPSMLIPVAPVLKGYPRR